MINGSLDISVESWIAKHEETSKTIRRSIMLVVSYCFFCFLTLGAPDIKIFEANALVKIPFANAEVRYAAFFVFGPLALIGITIYLHIFVEQWTLLNHLKNEPPLNDQYSNLKTLPFIFNMERLSPNILSGFLIYLLIPITLFIFAWKSSDLVIFIMAAFITFFLLILKLRRYPAHRRRSFIYIFQWLFLLLFIVFSAYVLLVPSIIDRSLNLAEVNFSGRILRGQKFDKANLKNANLDKADLTRASLLGTDLSGATLKKADLEDANLKKAILVNANLQEANLVNAKLQDANLEDANLQKAVLGVAEAGRLAGMPAKLMNANLWEANLKEANLVGVNLKGADLNYAKLNDANLGGANFEEADLEDAELQGADFRWAKLSKCKNLTQIQLDSACGNEQTTLPPGLNISKCPKEKE